MAIGNKKGFGTFKGMTEYRPSSRLSAEQLIQRGVQDWPRVDDRPTNQQPGNSRSILPRGEDTGMGLAGSSQMRQVEQRPHQRSQGSSNTAARSNTEPNGRPEQARSQAYSGSNVVAQRPNQSQSRPPEGRKQTPGSSRQQTSVGQTQFPQSSVYAAPGSSRNVGTNVTNTNGTHSNGSMERRPAQALPVRGRSTRVSLPASSRRDSSTSSDTSDD